jgi:predicted nuclease of predicted toxin-antitoxin system
MNLLFDQNISFRILKWVDDIFPGSSSVHNLISDNPHDLDIWKFAKLNNFAIVTFDADFIDISNLRGYPPKIIWLRIGNTSTKNIADRLRAEQVSIEEFLRNSENAFLEIA